MAEHTRHNLLKTAGLFAAGISGLSINACQSMRQPIAPSAATKPNLLVVLVDDMAFNYIGYDNPNVHTPNLNALARRGMIFNRAFIASPICAASRASIMSGLFPEQHGVISLAGENFEAFFNEAPRADQTLPHQLTQAGYLTALYGKSHLGDPTDYGFNEGKVYGEHNDLKTFESAAVFLDAHAHDGQPFFLFLAPRQPHVPLLPDQQYLDLYPPDDVKLAGNWQVEPDPESINNQGLPGEHFYRDSDYRKNYHDLPAGPPRDQRTMREFIQAYQAVITHLDDQMGALIAQLDHLGLSKNTVIIFLSDNGYHLGDHGLGNKITMHEESVRIPMFIVGPGVPVGVRCDALVSSLDVYPTLMDLAGVQSPPDNLMGTSLLPLLADPQSKVRDVVFSECVGLGGQHGQGHRMARDQRYKLVLTGVNEQYLFDDQEDPLEQHNLIDNPSLTPVRDHLRAQLAAWMKQIGDREYPADAQ